MATYIRRATKEDLPAIMAIIAQAKEFLKDNDNPQWQDGHPTTAMITADIDHGYSWVMIDGDRVVGTADLQLAPEANYEAIQDGAWAQVDEPYAIIHRVAIGAAASGHHLGELMFSNLITVGRLQGIRNFRYDTHRKNIPMQKLGKTLGFVERGTVYIQDETDAEHLGFELNIQ